MFGDAVHGHRRRLGLTQEDLADRSGVSVRTIGKLESGRITAPRPHTLRALADALELTGGDRARFYESATAPGAPVRTADVLPVPAQLPADVPGFVGRAEHLAYLDALLARSGPDGDDPGRRTAVVISALSGTAGVGKTSLAVHWAHSVVDRFPDGQLYLNLRGFDPDGRAMQITEAIRGLLDALGVAPERLPSGLDAQVGLYRSLLADKRVLVVLDNARDAEQVQPLLPATPSAMALVTSRHQLTSLVAVSAAQPLLLDVLSTAEARELLARRIGADRVAAEPAAVEELATACARLPLALAITAARAQQTRFPLAALAAELREVGDRLDVLDAGSVTGQVRAVFSWSYRALSPPAARLFRLLGLHPGPDLSLAAAASLGGLSAADTRRLLAESVRANLLVEHLPGRYTFHDLLRAYAAELTTAHDSDLERDAATTRLLDHYVHTAHTADQLIDPVRGPMELPLVAPTPGARPERPDDYAAATAWFNAEYPVLLATVKQAALLRHETHCWQLVWALDTFQARQGRWREQLATWDTALRAAELLDDATARALAHAGIAKTAVLVGRLDDAQPHLERALELHTGTGYRQGMARTHHNLSHLWLGRGQLDRALSHMRQALDLYTAGGNQRGRARALASIAWIHLEQGEHARAVEICEAAVAEGTAIDDRIGVMHALDTLGWAYHHLGDHDRALEHLHRALAMTRDQAYRSLEATTLNSLGDAYHAAGRPDAARAAWSESLHVLTELDHPEAEQVRAKLDRPSPADG